MGRVIEQRLLNITPRKDRGEKWQTIDGRDLYKGQIGTVPISRKRQKWPVAQIERVGQSSKKHQRLGGKYCPAKSCLMGPRVNEHRNAKGTGQLLRNPGNGSVSE
jgi:hypothetical protein